MTDCTTIAPLLDAYLDGELTPAEQQRVAAHLATCASCRAEAEAIRSIVDDAHALPRSVLPERELWPGIVPRLTQGTVGLERAGTMPPLRRWLRVAAAIGLILFGAGLATLWQRSTAPSPFVAEQARYTAASTALAEKLAADPGQLTPSTRAVVERNLAIIDLAIREAETALASDPGNTPLEQMLVARYEQRLALLRRATSPRGMES